MLRALNSLKKRHLFLEADWPGNNKVLCGGRMIMGPDYKSAFFTLVLINTLSCLLILFPLEYFKEETILFWITLILQLSASATLLLTSTMNPGIIPRQTVHYKKLLYEEVDDEDNYVTMEKKYHSVSIVQGHLLDLKYCGTCSIMRPPRTSHCGECNNCVEMFDHHCPWVGNCIGKRNYRVFFSFLSIATVFCIFSLTICITHLIKLSEDIAEENDTSGSSEFGSAISEAPWTMTLLVIVFLLSIFVVALFVFHVSLILNGDTTNERLKEKWRTRAGSPYRKPTRCGNILMMVCNFSTPMLYKIISGVPTQRPSQRELGGGKFSRQRTPETSKALTPNVKEHIVKRIPSQEIPSLDLEHVTEHYSTSSYRRGRTTAAVGGDEWNNGLDSIADTTDSRQHTVKGSKRNRNKVHSEISSAKAMSAKRKLPPVGKKDTYTFGASKSSGGIQVPQSFYEEGSKPHYRPKGDGNRPDRKIPKGATARKLFIMTHDMWDGQDGRDGDESPIRTTDRTRNNENEAIRYGSRDISGFEGGVISRDEETGTINSMQTNNTE